MTWIIGVPKQLSEAIKSHMKADMLPKMIRKNIKEIDINVVISIINHQ